MTSGDDRRYVRAIEATWSRFKGRPAVVSPREFETIDSWRRRGVPLAVVLEVIEAMRKRRAGKAPRSLTALSEAVEEAWSAVAAGRSAGSPPARRSHPEAALACWDEALRGAPVGSPVHALLARLIEDARAGRDAAALDEALDSALAAAVPAELLDRSRRESQGALAPFRSRMSDHEFGRMLERAIVDRLRLALVLPRLALVR